MELRARFVVEGFIAGLHKSPYHGFSVEFSEHRQYMPGDDLKYLDWKILGRTDRYYIKQYEEETNLKSYIILDTSRSMHFKSGENILTKHFPFKKYFTKKKAIAEKSDNLRITKLEYGTYLAASLALLMNYQKDASGLILYDEKINNYIPPKATKQNLKLILKQLSNIIPSGKTNTAEALNLTAEKIKRRGLIIVLSDLFDEQQKVINSLKHFKYKKNEVIVFQILDPFEMNLLIDTPTLLKDMETEKEMLWEPISIINSYKEAIQEFIQNYKHSCLMNNIDYVLISTETPFDIALLNYLNKRKRLN